MPKESPSKAKHWGELIEKWRASGLSQKQWCKEQGIALSTFHYWLHKPASKKSTPASFIELAAETAYPGSSGIELRLGPAKINLEVDFDADTLQRLVKALGSLV